MFLLLIIQKTFANIGIFFIFAVYFKDLNLKTRFKHWLYILLLLVVGLFYSCSTAKDKWINRQYNSIVAHYNAWWNGNEALKEGVKTLEKSHKDDFTKIIPIYKLGTKENATAIKANTDRAIEKGSKVIQKYSMKFSGVEKNPQIDDAYLLMGKACFYAQDYPAALATFNLLIAQYKDKKESFEPMIWLALTNSKMGNHSECDILLDQVRNKIDEGKAPKGLSNFMNLVYAENALSQGKNAVALEYFAKRKFAPFEKDLNTRLMFIKGQIYQKADEYEEATKFFNKVARRAGNYEMEFASRLNIAMCYDPKKANSRPIISRLEKMLEDKKNVEYKDQVYYALGEVYFRDKNVDKACLQWEESSAASTTNKIQKITSCLRAANTYFDLLEKYEKAQMYYDTALAVMPKDYPSFKTIESRQKVLTNLVTNLRCIERWDSLLAMSVMSEADLNAKIDAWIAEYQRIQKEKEEEAKKAQALAASMAGMTNYSQFNNRNSWYFYNSSTVQVGQLEFRRIWGERKLEDNWRISHKESEFDFEEMAEMLDENGNPIDSTSSKGGAKANNNPGSREYYTKDIPFSQGAKDTANAEIAEALLAAGYIYYQGLNNMGKAIETFLELHRRYPTHKNVLPSSYHLYRLYDKIGQYPNSNFYKNKILNEYPDSEFAMMINNPDYWEALAKSNENAEKMYADVYDTYLKDRYEEAIAKSQEVIDSLKIGPYIPKLLYVQALAKGRIYGIDSLAMDLNLILHNYTESEIAPMIESQLKHLAATYPDGKIDLTYTPKSNQDDEIDKTKDDVNKEGVKDEEVKKDDILDAETLVFRYRDMKHYYVVLFNEDRVDAIELERNIKTFNDSLFANNNFTTMAMLFTMTKQMISVRQFENKEKAMEYYYLMDGDSSPLVKHDKKNFNHFVISTQNYPTFYNRQNIEAYLKFFKLMYLNNQN